MNVAIGLAATLAAYSAVLLTKRFFGVTGLTAWCVLATVIANVAVAKCVNVMGRPVNLGSIMFATNYLAADIINEEWGEKEAKQAIRIALLGVIVFLASTQVILAFRPNCEDFADAPMRELFSLTPRIAVASVSMFYVSNIADVRLYSWLREKTNGKYVWLRANASTILCNCVENVLFLAIAFFPMLTAGQIVEMSLAGSAIEVVLSVIDTPFIYLSRNIRPAER